APYYFLIGLIIAIVDFLPVVGSGLILIPWAIYSFISSNSSFGYKLILLYIIAMIIRQILEPRIIGKSIGLRPLYTFLSTVIGSLVFGPIGVFIGPIIAIILNTIYLKQTVNDLKDNEAKNKLVK
ncbi:MAG TPA: AI-2E family transporter, partial [Tissierellaceae bacterium]